MPVNDHIVYHKFHLNKNYGFIFFIKISIRVLFAQNVGVKYFIISYSYVLFLLQLYFVLKDVLFMVL